MIKPIPMIDAVIPSILLGVLLAYVFGVVVLWVKMSLAAEANWADFVEDGRRAGVIPQGETINRTLKMHLFNVYIITLFSVTWPLGVLLGANATQGKWEKED